MVINYFYDHGMELWVSLSKNGKHYDRKLTKEREGAWFRFCGKKYFFRWNDFRRV